MVGSKCSRERDEPLIRREVAKHVTSDWEKLWPSRQKDGPQTWQQGHQGSRTDLQQGDENTRGLAHCEEVVTYYVLRKDKIKTWHEVLLGSAAQPCLTLCNAMDCSPPGSSVPGISQARRLEWVAMPSSRGSSWPRDWTRVSCTGRRILYRWAAGEAAGGDD